MRPTRCFAAFLDVLLAGWDGQEPHQQSEQDQRPDQGKQCVQRVKVEILIPREAISCGQHTTSWRVVTVQMDAVPASILPPNFGQDCCFLCACVTPFA
jgi:hypothetical protein